MNTKYKYHSFRVPSDMSKTYWEKQVQLFANHLKTRFPDITEIELGKQDTRGHGLSLVLWNNGNITHPQKFFSDKWELIGFIDGYNKALNHEGWL